MEIAKILKDRQKNRTELISHLVNEEAWQRYAFTFLLSERDKRSAQLKEDIRLVIEQLNQLTGWEIQRKEQRASTMTVCLPFFFFLLNFIL